MNSSIVNTYENVSDFFRNYMTINVCKTYQLVCRKTINYFDNGISKEPLIPMVFLIQNVGQINREVPLPSSTDNKPYKPNFCWRQIIQFSHFPHLTPLSKLPKFGKFQSWLIQSLADSTRRPNHRCSFYYWSNQKKVSPQR